MDEEVVGWTVFGVACVAALAFVFLGVIQNIREGDADSQRTERTRIEECGKVQPDELKAYCINGVNADVNIFNEAR